MPQLTLYSPEITCDHCIGTIEEAVSGVQGARFLSGDPDRKQFAIEVDGGSALDSVVAALQEAGYAPGDVAEAAEASPGVAAADWRPEYSVTRTDAGADVNYACPCSCDAGFALDRSRAEQDPEGCCCGRRLVVGADAETRLRAALDDPEAYRIDVQALSMPWGQPMDAALAIPAES